MKPDALAPLRTPGALLAFIGAILILVPEVTMVQWYLASASLLPFLPPETLPVMQFWLQVLLETIAGAVACGIIVLAGAATTLTRSAAIGGFLDLTLAIPVFLVTGLLGSIGAALAIIGGALALLSAIRPPQKERRQRTASR
jgi:hypothetical protein